MSSKWRGRDRYQKTNVDTSEEESMDKIKEIQMCIDSSKAEVNKAIGKTIERGDKLEDLEFQAQNLQGEAEIFNRTTRAVRTRMCWQNIKIKLLFVIVFIILALIVYFVFIHPLVTKK
eukprot:UN00674